jgi:formamidopyrimidine-DNA glycosylase
MPELPDIVVYIEALEQRILGETLERVAVTAPFLLRTATPPIASVEGRKVVELRRLGKRICIGVEDDHWLILHLMIAGRLHWHERVHIRTGSGSDRVAVRSRRPTVKERLPNRVSKSRLATFQFPNGTLSLTEAGTQRRASLHLVESEAGLDRLDPGGLEIFEIDVEKFARVLQSENHTLKRALTDPRLFSGIGNAYSDEILWEARMSPVALTQKLTSEEIERLFNSTRAALTKWIELLRGELENARGSSPTVKGRSTKIRTGSGSDRVKATTTAFPEKVTAFRPEMAAHGKYQQPCPRCGAKIQRIRYASNETNYCPSCQTGGKLLADRALSRLLRADWPRTADELEGLTPSSRKL